MTRGRLLFAGLVALGLWSAANVMVRRLADQSLPRQLLGAAQGTPHIDVLVSGNSVVREGFDAAAFQRTAGTKVSAFNAGLGGTTELEHLLLVKSIIGMHPEI